jgi:endonuclease III
MDLQVPALAWQRTATGYTRLFYPQGRRVRVEVSVAGQALRFQFGPTGQVDLLRAALTVMFRRQVADLHLGRHPALRALRAQFRGVVLMRSVDPFEALVLTVLAQHRSARAVPVREVYRDLVAAAGGTGVARFAGLDRRTLAGLIRPAGPDTAGRLAGIVAAVVERGVELFDTTVYQASAGEALGFLTGLPGVGHTTAACVLVCAGRRRALPVGADLVRVAGRLGLVCDPGARTPSVRERTMTGLLDHAPDVAAAHILLRAVGRTTCTAGRPACEGCFLRPHCPTAGTPAPPPSSGAQHA